MAAKHRTPDTTGAQHPLIRAGVDRYLVWLQGTLAVANLIATVGLLLDQAGTSPGMLFLQAVAPLWLWAVCPAAVTALLLAGVLGYQVQVPAHAIGMFFWTFLTVGTVTGVVTLTTPSLSSSVILAALQIAVSGWHAGALLFRRRLARLG